MTVFIVRNKTIGSQSIQFVAGFLCALKNHLSANTRMEGCVGRPNRFSCRWSFWTEIGIASSLAHVSSRWLVCPDIDEKIEIVSLWHCIILLWIPFQCSNPCQSSLPTVTLAAAVAHVRKRRKKTWCWPQLLGPFQIPTLCRTLSTCYRLG